MWRWWTQQVITNQPFTVLLLTKQWAREEGNKWKGKGIIKVFLALKLGSFWLNKLLKSFYSQCQVMCVNLSVIQCHTNSNK